MVYKIGILKHFATFTGKTLRWSLVFNNVASRKISEKSQENTCSGVLFLINSQAKRFLKILKRKTSVLESYL